MKISTRPSRRAIAAALSLGLTGALAGAPSLAHAQAATGAAEEPSQGLDEIVVTAQRREENLQDVPISVTAVAGDTLNRIGVVGTTGLSQVVPSVRVTQSGPGAVFFIRGVGNTSGSVGEEGANALYIDGVYLGDLTSAATKFNNIERIEVLKGPQGTLFGRNSSGGLINIITREPGDQVVIHAKAGYGNYDTLQGQLYAATPLGDKLSVDLSLTGKDQKNGFGTNFATGKDVQLGWYYGARSKLVYRPDETTKIVVSGDYYKDHDDYQNGFNLFKGTVGVGGYQYPGDYNLNTTTPEYANFYTYGGALTVEHQFDWATLTSITARRGVKVRSGFDADYTPAPITSAFVPSRVRTFQQELRLASASTTPFSWQIGAFYYRATANVDGFSLRGTGLGGLNSGYDIVARMRTKSIAGFGEASYDVTPTTHVTAGIRYTEDKRYYDGTQLAVNIPTTSPLFAVFNVGTRHQSFSTGRATYRLAVRQDLTDDINVYASYNRGFKSGIFATTGSPADPPVKPQTIDAFEVGFKSQLFDNMLRLNVAGFHYKINDYQVRASPAPGQTRLLNAAVVKVDGVEGEVQLAPAKGLLLSVNATYLDSRFANFPGALFNYPLPSACSVPAGGDPPGATTGPATGGGRNCTGNARGNQTPLSPKFSSSTGISYHTPLGDDAEMIFNGSWSYSSTIYFEADNRLKQPAYSVFNLSLEFRPSHLWGIELWANNIGDKHYYFTGTAGTTGDHGELAAPRTYGINLKFDM